MKITAFKATLGHKFSINIASQISVSLSVVFENIVLHQRHFSLVSDSRFSPHLSTYSKGVDHRFEQKREHYTRQIMFIPSERTISKTSAMKKTA